MNEYNRDPTAKTGKKIRKLFSPQEDALLTQIMYKQPFETWSAVAEQLPGRTARQCRDRWVNYLSPSNKNGPWTHEEDQLLAEKYIEHGPQWTTIAKFFDGRSENNVKNRWYTYVKARFNSNQIPVQPVNSRKRAPARSVQPQVVPAMKPIALFPVKVAMTPAPQPTYQFRQVMPQQVEQPKTLLPPITAFDNSIPANSTVATIPQSFYSIPRIRSESVRPYTIQPIFQ